MKIYEICDYENKAFIGVLLYYEKEKSFIIELNDNLDEWSAPLLFTSFVKRSEYTIPREAALMWVKERIIPNTRQNIGSILKTHKLKEYDEMKFLELSEAKCSQDSLYIKKIDILPGFVEKRNKNNLIDCLIIPDKYILCFFKDGLTKKVSYNAIEKTEKGKQIISNKALLKSGKIGVGGYYITFNDSIDISAYYLYENGEAMDISLDDFKLFSKESVLDTGESCDILECSRQNLSHHLKQGRLTPLKENVKGNLYLKSDIIRNSW